MRRQTLDLHNNDSGIESLSAKYSDLDEPGNTLPASQKRHRLAQWPKLEKALYQWVLEIEIPGCVTGDLIKSKAAEFWRRLAPYQGMEVPVFSNGTLNMQEIEEQLIAVKAIASQFSPADCYNCDETGLFYVLLPEKGLSTRQLPGVKQDKARLSVHFCFNADGSDKLPLWFIGEAAKPRCLGAANVQITAFNCVWKSNKTAWMTTEVMVEWLYWFSRHVQGRRVLLTMDNFSAHVKALKVI
ncbi:hypothetical protein CERZMDRAFT_107905 [Cercospora zeae-maydis SCOH1-5]|uniref:DDE-1 domain-containing protein n=1 Tax=Cercospora zeae-maydis SCOH1-5 TaxID=717836 RepID=A0A6A6F1D7_9PEZI|nr:hypothetical protein CERZMDRAFT_107905 [Cercospora zeae-maydis SCOH1-5]